MKSSRILFFIMVSLGFAFLITQQRLESHQYDSQISSLNREIEKINSQKRDIHFQIQQQMQRLALNSGSVTGQPISIQDIIPVQVETSPLTLAQGISNDSPIDQVLGRLFTWSKLHRIP